MTTGARNSTDGSGNTNLLIDDNADDTYSVMYSENPATDGAWAKLPHNGCAADINGDGVQEMVFAVFTPDTADKKLLYNQETKGAVELRIISREYNTATKTASIKTTRVPVAGSFSVKVIDMENSRYSIDIAAADMDNDGSDELVLAVDTTLLFLNASFTDAKPIADAVNYRVESDTSYALHYLSLATGDITGDGIPEAVVTYGMDVASATAKYAVFGIQDGALKTITAMTPIYNDYHKGVTDATVAIGDIDGDDKNEVVFAGHVSGTGGSYRIYAAEYNAATRFLEFAQINSATTVVSPYDWNYARKIPLDIISINDGSRRINYIYSFRNVSEFSAATGLTTKYTIPVTCSSGMGKVGDVNQDGNEEIVIVTNDGLQRLMTFGLTAAKTWGQLLVGTMYADQATSVEYYDLVLADIDGDSEALQYVPGSRTLTFTNPMVMAVLASAPHYAKYGAAGTTSFGTTNSSGSENSHTFSVGVGVTVGVSMETPLWGSAFSMESTVSVSANFSYGMARSYETSISRGFSVGDEDLVIFSCTPFDSYTYRVLRRTESGSAPDSADEEFVYVSIPRQTQILALERNKFNAIPENPVIIDSTVLPHTIGNPATYFTKNEIKAYIDADKSFGLWDATGYHFASSSETGTYDVELSRTTTDTQVIGAGLSITRELRVTVNAAVFGLENSFGYDYEYSFSTSQSTFMSTEIPFLPTGAASEDSFTAGPAMYQTKLAGQDMPIIMANYWVDMDN